MPLRSGMLLAGLALLVGCGARDEAYPRLAGRAIAETPSTMLSLDGLESTAWSATPPRVPAADGEATEASAPTAWTFGADGYRLSIAEGRTPNTVASSAVASNAVASNAVASDPAGVVSGIDADSVEAIVMDLARSNHRGLRVRWSRDVEGTETSFSAGVERAIGQKRTSRSHRVQLQLAGVEGWTGTIRHLRIEPLPPKSGEALVRLRNVTLTTRGYDPAAVVELTETPRWVDLQGDVRGAWVVAPGHATEGAAIDAPAGGTLRFALGGLGRLDGPTAVRVDDASSDEVLWEGTVDPETFGSWQAVSTPIGPSAAPRRLRFSLPGDSRPLPGVVALADAEIVTRQPAVGDTGERPWNVVLISVDTLRADRLGLYGAERPTSPRLDAWVTEPGVTVFEQATVQASWTLPSHTSMLSGLDALHHGVNYDRPAPQHLDLLGEILRRTGRETFAVTGGAYLHPRYGLAQGFDRWIYWRGRGDDNDEIDRAYEHATTWLDERGDEPFFLFFHTYDVHHREVSRAPFFDLFSPDPIPPGGVHFAAPPGRIEEGFKKNRAWELEAAGERFPLPDELHNLPSDIYDSRVAYMDLVIGRLLEQLETRGLLDRTLVVLTSDHGELFGEHGQWGHLSVWEENTHVPLLVHVPGTPGGRVSRQVRSIDIVPTICDLLGLDTPIGVDGRSLRPFLEGEDDPAERPAWTYAAASNHGLSLRTDEGLKAHYNNTAYEPVRDEILVFRLDEDPDEARPLPDDERAKRLREVLARSYLATMPSLRLRVIAGPNEPLRARVSGTVVRKNGVKTPFAAGGPVGWIDPVQVDGTKVADAALDLEVPAGEELLLVFEDPGPGPWIEVLDVESGARARLDEAALALEPSTSYRVAIEDGQWTEASIPLPTFRGVVASRGGAADGSDTAGEAPDAVDDEIRSRLEALGYL